MKLEFNKEGILESEIITSDKKTFYTKYGDVFSIFNILFVIFMVIKSFKKIEIIKLKFIKQYIFFCA